MKTCPECGLPLPDGIKYCFFCGTKANISKFIKINRRFFFLTPIFILLLSIGIAYDLGSSNYSDVGISLAGIGISVYFFGSLLFGAIRLFSKIPFVSGSYFKASITSLVNFITSIFFVFSIENLFLKNFFEKQGPSNQTKYYLILFSLVFLTIQLLESFAILLKAKIIDNPELEKTIFKKIFFNYLYLEIPLDFFIITAIFFYLTTYPSKLAFMSKIMTNLSAKEKAAKYIDIGLEKYPDDAKLCYLKSKLLAEPELLLLTLDLKNEREALTFANKASVLKPESPLYKQHLSLLLDINKDVEKAINVASEAAYLAKNDVDLWQYLGDINQKYNHVSEAIAAYKKALKIESDNAIVLNNFSYMLLNNNQDLFFALELAKKSVKIEPTRIFNRDTLAWAYYKNNYYVNALETINTLYRNQSEISPEVDFHRIAILDANGMLNNPIKVYDKMLVRPEIVNNKTLILQIIEARKKAEEKQKRKAAK